MSQRHKRYGELFGPQKDALLLALGTCRRAVIAAQGHLNPNSPTYRLGGRLTEAIDALAQELTGDPCHFHTRPHYEEHVAGDQKAVAAAEIAMALPRLVRMAETNQLPLLAYLLDQARIEADRAARGEPT